MTDNPFSSRFIDPDSHPYLFPSEGMLAQIGARLSERAWWGEIVGPHGSGKSTLLHTLRRWAEEQGATTRFCFFNDRRRQLPGGWNQDPVPTLYVVDGAEQLAPWRWWRLWWHCRRRGCGLLITTHRTMGLPLIYRTHPADAATVQRIVTHIAGEMETPPDDRAARLAHQHGGNLRYVLFELYDRWAEAHHIIS